MVKLESKKLGDLLLLANGLVFVVLVNLLAGLTFTRWDLTEEKRYSIRPATKSMLEKLVEPVYIEVYLEGELNSSFRRFRQAIEETLVEFRVYSGNKVQYAFVNPTEAKSQKAQSEYVRELSMKGITPTNVIENKDGQTATKLIFPGALVACGGLEKGVMLLKGNKAASPEEEINQSIEGIEFELANTIYSLATEDRKRIGLITGHNEPDSLSLTAFRQALLSRYESDEVNLTKAVLPNTYDALVVTRPLAPFHEIEKFNLDQYIMQGGKVLFFLDKMVADMDSASAPGYLALPLDVGLDDQLFRYGVRLNVDLVQDRKSSVYPVVTGESGGKPRMQLLEWPFFPLINTYPDHPITRNLDAVLTRFTSSVDTVKAVGVKKLPLLLTSPYSRTKGAPASVSISDVLNTSPESYNQGSVPVAVLLEGTFTSLYKNRFLPVESTSFAESSVPTKLLVVADGDMIVNEVNPRTRQPQALGFDPFSQYTFANEDFVMNALAYLTDEDGLIQSRTKQIKIRPLDKPRIAQERKRWQMINVAAPLILLVVFGLIRNYMRKKRYSAF